MKFIDVRDGTCKRQDKTISKMNNNSISLDDWKAEDLMINSMAVLKANKMPTIQ